METEVLSLIIYGVVALAAISIIVMIIKKLFSLAIKIGIIVAIIIMIANYEQIFNLFTK